MKKKRQNVSTFGYVFRIFLIVLLSPFLIVYIIYQKIKNRKKSKENLQKLAIFTISQVDLLSGTEFEQFLKSMFEAMGYLVYLTKATGDYGADLIAERDGKVYVIQAKRYSKTVGAHAVQEVLGAKQHYNANEAIVATNYYFSKEAKDIAFENNIKLIDRVGLENLVKKLNVKIDYTGSKFSAMTSNAKQEIETRYRYFI